MLNKVVTALACAALVCALGLGWYTATVRAENKRLSATVAGLTTELRASHTLRKIDQAVAARHVQRVATLTTIQKDTDAKLAAALVRESNWAGTDVPPDVAAALGLQLPAAP